MGGSGDLLARMGPISNTCILRCTLVETRETQPGLYDVGSSGGNFLSRSPEAWKLYRGLSSEFPL